MARAAQRSSKRDQDGVPVSYALTRLSRAIGRDLIAAKLTLSGPQVAALLALRRESGLSNAQLARRAYVSPQAMNEVTLELERRDLIERHPDQGNRRILRARLTSAGETILTSWDAAIDDVEDQLFDGFSSAELRAFSRALDRCVANMGLRGGR